VAGEVADEVFVEVVIGDFVGDSGVVVVIGAGAVIEVVEVAVVLIAVAVAVAFEEVDDWLCEISGLFCCHLRDVYYRTLILQTLDSCISLVTST